MAKDERFVAGDTFILPCTVKYAYTKEPDTGFNQSSWKVTCVLDKTWDKELRKAGFKVRVDKDGDNVITARRKTKTAKGISLDPPNVIDAAMGKFDDIIGNGSVCNVMIFGKYSNPHDPDQVVAYLNGIQVLEHVEYNPGSARFTAVESAAS